MARKPETTWEMLNVAMSHFQSHISSKSDRCSLSIVDLLHVSNFKGGNASITEPVTTLPGKLAHYEKALKEVDRKFKDKHLAKLNKQEKTSLIECCNNFLKLTNVSSSKIRGFGASYASALLAAHFIDLIPVLDRRALNGAGIAAEKYKQGQVKNISNYYSSLIEAFSEELKRAPNITLREIDKKWFSKNL